jgi:hypothetical protein
MPHLISLVHLKIQRTGKYPKGPFRRTRAPNAPENTKIRDQTTQSRDGWMLFFNTMRSQRRSAPPHPAARQTFGKHFSSAEKMFTTRSSIRG